MSFESFNPEKTAERVLTRQEVQEAIEKFITGEFHVARVLEDNEGPYLFEVEIPGETSSEVTEFSYRRKGNFKESSSAMTVINCAYYEDGMPVGGRIVASFVNNEWIEES